MTDYYNFFYFPASTVPQWFYCHVMKKRKKEVLIIYTVEIPHCRNYRLYSIKLISGLFKSDTIVVSCRRPPYCLHWLEKKVVPTCKSSPSYEWIKNKQVTKLLSNIWLILQDHVITLCMSSSLAFNVYSFCAVRLDKSFVTCLFLIHS
jgi:hypothetical protein